MIKQPIQNNQYILKMVNIHKSFNNNAIKANEGINLLVKRNSIHAILGENGAGKSTLLSILFGICKPDKGEIYLNDELVNFKSAKDAFHSGIGMVSQHFKLIDNFTVFNNIILGAEDLLPNKQAYKRLEELIDQYKFDLKLKAKISSLSVSQKQKVEILKVLYRNSDIMIFDEPTAVLADEEIERFLNLLLDFQKANKTIIIITHKLNEIKKVANEATVIRKGKFIESFDVAATSIEKMSELMVGKKITSQINDSMQDFYKDNEVVLKINNLVLNTKNHDYWDKAKIYLNKLVDTHIHKKKATDAEFKKQLLKGLNFEIRRGEILGLAGIDDNGQQELINALIGWTKSKPNTIIFKNQDISTYSIKKRIDLGISYVPQDRHLIGLDLKDSVRNNLFSNQIDTKPYSQYGFLIEHEIANKASVLIDKFDIRGTGNGTSFSGSLSGGNQQKIIIAREMSKNHELLILFNPTRGVDVGAIRFIHEQIFKAKKENVAILLISYELDEIFALADSIGVISNKQILEIGHRSYMDRIKVGQLMTKGSLEGGSDV